MDGWNPTSPMRAELRPAIDSQDSLYYDPANGWWDTLRFSSVRRRGLPVGGGFWNRVLTISLRCLGQSDIWTRYR